VISNVNKPAPYSTICHLARKCSTAGNGHQDALFLQLSDALSRNGIRSRSLVCAILDSRVTEKNPSRAEIRGLGRRPPSGRLCRKSRAANHVRGGERIADRHGAYRPALPGFGTVEETEELPLPYRFTVCRFVVID
jgi:hypothetical protein